MDEKLAVTVEEAIKMVGAGRSTGYKLVATGEWPSLRIGRAIRVPIAGLKAWLEANTSNGAA